VSQWKDCFPGNRLVQKTPIPHLYRPSSSAVKARRYMLPYNGCNGTLT
jgi:hypothetical protein